MPTNTLKKHWLTLSKELKERWPDLTPTDFEYIDGFEDRLVDTVALRRHIPRLEAERDVQDFLEHLSVVQRPPQ